jgi:T5orf172 domain
MLQLQIHCVKCTRALSFLLDQDSGLTLVCQYCGAEIGKSTPASGFLYALANDTMPGLLKIGFTTRKVEERVVELDSSTAVPRPFEVSFYFVCSEPQSDEALAHDTLGKYRLNQGREFFRITDTEALKILREKLGRQEVFLNSKRHEGNSGSDSYLHGLDESTRNEVEGLRKIWATTEGAAKGISLIYRLMSESRYSDAKTVADLFLADNPNHGVALRLSKKIDAMVKR